MTDQATHEFQAAEISEKAIAEGAKVKRPTASAVQQRADVKGHLLKAMADSVDTAPHGDKGMEFALLTIERTKKAWKVDESGKRLSDAEVFAISEQLPGTKANKAFKARSVN